MKLFNFFIYFFTLFLFFFIFVIFFNFIKSKIIFKKEEKSEKAHYKDRFLSYNFSIKVNTKFLKIVILFLILNTSSVFLLPWAYNVKKLGFSGLIYGLIFLFILILAYFYILREGEIE